MQGNEAQPALSTPLQQQRKLQEVQGLATELMAQHGLVGWQFRFNRRKRNMGVCFYPHHGLVGRIELSIYFVLKNRDDEIRDTILHEIAHALTGREHGHDDVWKAKCLEIGAVPKRCGQADMPVGRWQAVCPSCSRGFHRHRRPNASVKFHCRTCGPELGSIVWKRAY